MKKLTLIAAIAFAGMLAFSGAAQADCGPNPPAACGTCNSASGETNGCVQGTSGVWVAGNAQTANGCVCVGGVASAKNGTTVTPNASSSVCNAAAINGCNGN